MEHNYLFYPSRAEKSFLMKTKWVVSTTTSYKGRNLTSPNQNQILTPFSAQQKNYIAFSFNGLLGLS